MYEMVQTVQWHFSCILPNYASTIKSNGFLDTNFQPRKIRVDKTHPLTHLSNSNRIDTYRRKANEINLFTSQMENSWKKDFVKITRTVTQKQWVQRLHNSSVFSRLENTPPYPPLHEYLKEYILLTTNSIDFLFL